MAELLVPEYVDGRPTFVPYAIDIQRKLKEGDPTIGWEGDPRLYIAPSDDGGYVVGRLEENGSRSLVCYGRPGSVIDERLLISLRDNDLRKNDVLKRIETKNEAIKKAQDEEFVAVTSEAIERVAWGINKDLGHKA